MNKQIIPFGRVVKQWILVQQPRLPEIRKTYFRRQARWSWVMIIPSLHFIFNYLAACFPLANTWGFDCSRLPVAYMGQKWYGQCRCCRL